MKYRAIKLIAAAAALGTAVAASAADRFITVASTTSTQNSGLFEYMLPKFQEKMGIEVRVVAVGTGQAIRNARNGDADVLFVHHKPSEEKFVSEGFGVKRHDVMYNDFVLIGPKDDAAKVRGLKDITKALDKIAAGKAAFASRGDDSGTHKKERGLWKTAGIAIDESSGSWYRETGSGMGATLNAASGMNAYVLSDRATWLNFGNKGELEILVEGDPRLFNQYGIILVNPAKHKHVKADEGQRFVSWVVSPEGQKIIGAYQIKGNQAFFPNAK